MKTKLKLFYVLSAVALTSILGLSTVANASGVNGADESNDKTKLSFGVISDVHTHVGLDWKGDPYTDYQAEQKFSSALQDLNGINPKSDGLVVNGDLTVAGTQHDYNDFFKIFNANPHPKNTMFSMGNHEYYRALYSANDETVYNPSGFPNEQTEQSSIDRYLQNTDMPNLYYDKVIKGYHFIVLGSEQSRITKWTNYDNAVLSDMQLQWLDNELKQTSPNRPTFVFLHQPIPYTVAGSNANYIINSDKLVNILNKYPQVILFSGHSHWTLKNQPGTMWQGKFTAFNDSCVVNPWNPTTQSLVGDSEGLYVQVYKDKVVVTGRDFTNKSWIDSYTVKIPSLKSSNESDQFESAKNSN